MFTRSYRAVNLTKMQDGLAARAGGTSVSGMVLTLMCSLGKVFQRTQGNIARWLKKEGDQVSAGEVLCEVETDKATVEMECMEEGYLAKIIHGDGAKEIKVGEVIAITVEEKDDIEKFKDYKPQTSNGASPQDPPASTPAKEEVIEKPVSPPKPKAVKPSSAPETNRIFANPLARKLAEDNNVSLSSIKGTGPDGSIVKADIEEYLASGKKDLAAAPSKADKTTVSAINYTDIPHSQIRKVTASRLRVELNSLQEASGGKKISINDLVIKDADKKGLSAISEDVKILAKKARENSLKPAEYEGGTFTVSNLGGPFGIKQFCAIINPPQAGILAVGSAERRVIPGSGVGQFKFASYMPVTLSCDHRVIDGAVGAEWLKAFKGYIENPETMLL
ncbi:hypothetical protein L1987_70522 [Smallanthus sonchifolius]|uniref:Uncharacterized protein n=1 Tax=Smallanthus sonchifolius TaxID=185202 RepID=A0ACB9AQ60_9ASTR|nr:hypothetical protein L1987_70522 [Smallanthus sonchifolius]